MSTSSAAADYAGVVDLFKSASQGGYRGPGISVDRISQALGTTEGLNPGSILTNTQAAVGSSSSAGMGGGFILQIAKFLGQAALGEILGRIGDTVLDWTNNRDQSEELERSAEKAGDALTDIEEVSETAITEILFALRAVISQLSVFLSRLDLAQHPREFGECVATGAELIDSAGSAILGSCVDRDEAVSGCLDEFLSRGESVCEQPVTRAQEHAVTCEDSAKASVGAPTTAAESPTKPQSVAPPSSPKEMEPPLPTTSTEDCPPETNKPDDNCDEDVPTTPQTAEPPPEPPVPPTPREPVAPGDGSSECDNREEIRTGCTGVLGAIGIGVLLVGIELVVEVLVEHTPEPIPEPIPEPEPAPEPAPEPPPPPKQIVDEGPPPDLSQVEEPPPPPKKFIPAMNSTPAPVDSPVQPDDSASLQQSQPQTPASVSGGARKAGEW